jgi:hypothetical protein
LGVGDVVARVAPVVRRLRRLDRIERFLDRARRSRGSGLVVRYLAPCEILLINQVEVGKDLLVDLGLLEWRRCALSKASSGAMPIPRHTHEGAGLMHSLIRNHCLSTGTNERQFWPLVCSTTLNGWDFGVDQDALIALAVDVAEGHLDVDRIAGLLKAAAHEQQLPTD